MEREPALIVGLKRKTLEKMRVWKDEGKARGEHH